MWSIRWLIIEIEQFFFFYSFSSDCGSICANECVWDLSSYVHVFLSQFPWPQRTESSLSSQKESGAMRFHKIPWIYVHMTPIVLFEYMFTWRFHHKSISWNFTYKSEIYMLFLWDTYNKTIYHTWCMRVWNLYV